MIFAERFSHFRTRSEQRQVNEDGCDKRTHATWMFVMNASFATLHARRDRVRHCCAVPKLEGERATRQHDSWSTKSLMATERQMVISYAAPDLRNREQSVRPICLFVSDGPESATGPQQVRRALPSFRFLGRMARQRSASSVTVGKALSRYCCQR